jgi:hypothetical protein
MGYSLGPNVTAQPLPCVASAGALEASRVLAGQKAILFLLNITNTKASAQFVQLHDAAALPADGVTPVMTFTLAASSSSTVTLGMRGVLFLNGIVVCNSSTAATKTIGSADCLFSGQVA